MERWTDGAISLHLRRMALNMHSDVADGLGAVRERLTQVPHQIPEASH